MATTVTTATALVVGPGLTRASDRDGLAGLYRGDPRPAVWDASALAEIAGAEVGVPLLERVGVEELRDALAKSKRAKLAAIVQESLSRDTLKDICSAVGLDDTGKEKAALVERM